MKIMDSWNIERQPISTVIDFYIESVASYPKRIICFDYFDTLAVRLIEPEYTKNLATSLLSMIVGRKLSGEQIYALRQEMERTLCECNADSGKDLDFNLNDLAFQLFDKLKEQMQGVLNGFSRRQFSEIMLSIELSVECTVQQLCRPVVELLEAIHRHGLETVLVSDFYLPERYFREMIKYHGIEKLIDHIYISADYGLTKGSGKLYGRIVEDLGCQPKQMLMIGDNAHADIKMAAEAGLETICIENTRQRNFYRNWREQYQRQIKSKDTGFDVPLGKDVVFPELGISLWLFTCRLFQALISNQVRDVFFFSKEGELLKRLFDDFQKNLYGTEIIRTHYLAVSRKATFLASLRPLEDENFSRLFNHYRDISLRDFMLSLNIDEGQAEGICNSLGLDFKMRFCDLRSQPDFKRLLKSEEFKEVYKKLRQEQKMGFLTYLDSLGIDYPAEGLFIVDVGWKGSIQDNIYHILGGRTSVHGFYIGSLIATELRSNNRKTGILFSDRPAPTPFFKVYNNNRSLFEMMLGASHGSADGYVRKSDLTGCQNNRKQRVFSSVAAGGEEFCVMVLDLPKERRLFESTIKPLQQHIVTVAAACTREFMLNECRLPEGDWFARQHARMVFRPTAEEIEFYESLYHLENFGVFEYTDFKRDSRATWKQRWANFKGVLLHPEMLESGIWPPIILRRLGVGPLRYYDGLRRSIDEFGLKW